VTSPRFERLAIVGLGLLGGSVALAARRAALAGRVVAAGRRRAPLERALAAGVVDEIADLAGAVKGADLIVLATPIGTMVPLMEQAAPHLAEGALITDVGSVKEPLADRLPGVMPPGVHYIGAHPMAGSHERGVDHAREDLFDGACCVITPLASADRDAVESVRHFWTALGARVVERDPARHDAEVAWVSHAPHLLAFAFAHALGEAPGGAAELAGTGLRDFTRIARSDSELWSEILDVNRKSLAGPLQAFRRSLDQLARAVESGDTDALENLLTAARIALGSVSPADPDASEAGEEGRRESKRSRPIRGRKPGNSG
jgi:prephenate dehydrogenase